MNKLYYLFYCMVAGVDEDAAKVKNEKFTPPYSKARQFFAFCVFMYTCTFMQYTGLVYLLPNDGGRKSALILLFVVVFGLSNIYFSKAEEEIVRYYGEKRSDSKFKDVRLAFLILMSSFILLLIYFWLRTILPLPLIQNFMK